MFIASSILEAFDSSLQGYRYTLNTGDMTPVLEDDGSITLYASDGETVVMTMPAPYLVDDNGVRNENVAVALQQDGDGYVLYYHLPTGWLAGAERAWPVILDPIIKADGYCKNVQDQTVMENTVPSYTAGLVQAGYSSANGKMRFFIKYTDIPALTSADVIVHAQMRLLKPNNSGTTSAVNVHKVLGFWTSQSITWSNMPGYDETIEDFVISKNSGYYYWDVTSIVQDWYTSGVNNGMMFKVPDSVENGGVNSWKQFYSSDYSCVAPDLWPTLTIMYRNISGLESYWDYTASGAGRAGTGYINNYSGNLVWTRTDLGFGGNRMPVSISHVYNTTDAQNNEFGLGNGWRANYHQKAYKPSGSPYYIWEDGDGTKHFFNYDKEERVYVDEDGLELALTELSGGVKITDKNGNASYFDSASRLYKIENNQKVKSSINITYTDSSGFKIATIKDGVDRTYNFTYNSDGLLSKITYVGKGTSEITSVSYTYSGSNLTQVTDKDGKNSEYTYNSENLMTAATDADGYKLAYSYTTYSPKRVAGVTEYQVKSDGSAVLGGGLTITYAHNQTTFEDHNGNLQIMQFNDFGNTISIQDGEGRAEYAQYALNLYNDSAESDADMSLRANQLRLSSRMQNTVCNMLYAGNFESGAAWSELNSEVTTAISSAEAYYGSKSMQITRSSAGTASGAYGIPLNVEGQWPTLTFSAYIKTGVGANAYLAFADEDGNVYATSQIVGSNQDWARLEVSYAPASNDGITVYYPQIMTTGAGTVYVDCAQLEMMPTASRYNLLDYGDFWGENALVNAWVMSSGMTGADGVTTTLIPAMSGMDRNVLSITGNPQAEKYVSQTISQSGAAGDCYVLSGWAYGNSAPLPGYDSNERQFGLKLIFNNTDGTTTEAYVSFNSDIPTGDRWQYAATPAVADKEYASVTVQVVYSYNVNTVMFDGLQLFKESFGSSYTYNADGKLTSVIDLQNSATSYEYTDNNLTKILENNKAKMRYEYDSWHNVVKAVTQTQDDSGNAVDNIVYEFEYDDYGNNTLVKVVNAENTISTAATYTSDGNRILTSIDSLANVTTYCYNENTNVLEWVQYPNDTEASRTTYTYDSMYRLASAAAAVSGLPEGAALTASYTYTDDLLTEIQTGSTTYSFSYGDFSQRSSIRVGSRTLAGYEYTQDRNRYLDKLTYGNGDTVEYAYDGEGRVILETFEDGSTVSYQYDNTGALATMTDSETGRKTTYYYDLTDRLMKYVENGSDFSHSVGYEYDTRSNLTKLVETINGVEHTTEYTYDDENRVTSVTNGSTTKSYTYDPFNRLSQRVTKNGDDTLLTDTFTYQNPTGTTTTGRIASLQSTAAHFNVIHSYTYDANGNILSISNGTNTTAYVYDSANQLIRENNQAAGKTWVWAYDNAGNILSRKEYAYTTGDLGTVLDTVTYAYGDSSWGDLLTAFDGNAITYDAIGNPLSDGTWTYTWQHGRQLAGMYGEGIGGGDNEVTITYTYDANGMRVGKTVTTKTYETIVTHTHSYTATTVAATCTTGGYTTYTCECGDSYQGNETAALGHSYTGSVVESTCTGEGYTVYTCSACGDTYQDNQTPALGHSYTETVVAPTCTEQGYTAHTCSVCGYSYHSDETAALGHDYTVQTNNKLNKRTYTCVRCGYSYTEPILGKPVDIIEPIVPVVPNPPVEVASTGAGGITATAAYVVADTAGTNTTERVLVSTEVQTYTYVYNGGSLMQETITTTVTTDDGTTTTAQTLDFAYDASGLPMSVTCNGETYYYVTNLQGDVTDILDDAGTALVTYTYDAWGNILTTTGSLASTLGIANPLRYRGYVYDTETGLYYLQSRYYNPEIGRFINADSFASTGQGLLGNNMFAYCRNNAVCRVDVSGAADQDCVDDRPLDDENLLNDRSGGGGGNCFDPQQAILDGTFSGSYSSSGVSSIPKTAWNVLSYLKGNNWHPPEKYRGGKTFANDGRENSQILPSDGAPYREYDIYPKVKGIDRGSERIVIGSNGTAWYTPNHYVSFIRME